MILKDKIRMALDEIQNFQKTASPESLYSLRDKLDDLLKLFNVDRSGNSMFIHYVNEIPMKFINTSIAECAEGGVGKDEIWITRAISDSKRYSVCSVNNFYIACILYNSPFLSEN